MILCVAAFGGAAAYIALSGRSPRGSLPTEPAASPGATLAEVQSLPHVLFRDAGLGITHGRLVLEARTGGVGKRYTTSVNCERVHFAGGRGVCLTAERGFTTVYEGFTFGTNLTPQHRFSLAGVPSRVRVSPSGRYAGLTVFVSGDSYAPGSFSTRTLVIDTNNGASLGDLEQYSVTRDGIPFSAVDFNFWGITFADDRQIYATLGTGGRTYLIAADIETRRARVLRENVECPSLSPDGSRIVFKKRMAIAGRLFWRLHVLDLRTGTEIALAETRSVDDQAEWRDAASVTYGLPSDSNPGSSDVWSVPSDGSGAPQKLLPAAWSPAFVRSPAGS